MDNFVAIVRHRDLVFQLTCYRTVRLKQDAFRTEILHMSILAAALLIRPLLV